MDSDKHGFLLPVILSVAKDLGIMLCVSEILRYAQNDKVRYISVFIGVHLWEKKFFKLSGVDFRGDAGITHRWKLHQLYKIIPAEAGRRFIKILKAA